MDEETLESIDLFKRLDTLTATELIRLSFLRGMITKTEYEESQSIVEIDE